jgi:cytochrome b subunit of formate dehydrogenase
MASSDTGERMNERTTAADGPSRTFSTRGSLERVLVRVDRYAAWLSAILLFLYFVSGYGMTKPDLVPFMTGGLISWRVAYDMHNVLHIPLLIVFTFHTFTGVRRALLRATRRRRLTAWMAAGLGLIVLGYLLTLSLYQSGL